MKQFGIGDSPFLALNGDVAEGSSLELERPTNQLFNALYSEMKNAIELSGQTLTTFVADNPKQLHCASIIQSLAADNFVDSGTENAKVLTQANSIELPQYTLLDGAVFTFKNTLSNTAETLLTVQNIGQPAAYPVKLNGVDLVADDLLEDHYYSVKFDLANSCFNIVGYPDQLRKDLSDQDGSSLVGFIQSGVGAVPRTSLSKMREQWSVKDFGAVGDGTVHTVLEWYTIGATYYRGYANLAAVQVDYPHVTSSTDSVDWAAIQQAIKLLPLNTADTVALTPQGFANGGCVQIPRGRYVIDKKITLQRGTRIVGESHESTQLLSKIAADSVLEYLDNGGYVPDEICLENFSIWQDASIFATTSAAIIVKRGTYPTSALQTIIKNVFIQGTYRGVFIEAGIGCSFDNVSATKCVSHGFDINNGGNSAYSTTSTTLKNCYASLNGGNGINVLGSSYISLQGCASDSNTGFGYRIDTANAIALNACGAERNVAGNYYVKDISGGVMQVHSVTQSGAVNGLTLNNAIGLTLISPNFLADVGNTGNGVFFEAAARPLIVIGPTFLNFATKYSSVNTVHQMNTATGQIVGGDTSNWTFGSTNVKDAAAQIAVVGNGDVATAIGVKSHVTFTFASVNRNNAYSAQAITADTAVSYPLLTGLYVANASKGAASSVTRTAGIYVAQQTLGSSANANIMIDAGVGAIPAGNWDLYSDSTRDSVFKGKLRLGALGATAPFITGGPGTPEGVLTAPIGSLWMRSDGGAGTSLYVKESGTGNTGWVAK